MELIAQAETSTPRNGGEGEIRLLLRLEGAVILAAALWMYAVLDASWLLFGILILAPDIAFLGYLRGRRIGVRCYNATHTYLAPAIMFMVLWLSGQELMEELTIIWVAHIAADRLLGFGLKYQADTKQTHLSG